MALTIETLNHCHVLEEKGYLFRSEDTQATEDEYLHLLHALVYATKPKSVLETGCYRGIGTTFMAKALKRNAEHLATKFYRYHGTITGIESTIEGAQHTWALLGANHVQEYARVIISDSVDYLENTQDKYEFAFFDTQIPLRCKELQICIDRGILGPGAFWAMHDTSRLRTLTPGNPDPQTEQLWKELPQIKGVKFLEFPLSRGLVVGQVTLGN